MAQLWRGEVAADNVNSSISLSWKLAADSVRGSCCCDSQQQNATACHGHPQLKHDLTGVVMPPQRQQRQQRQQQRQQRQQRQRRQQRQQRQRRQRRQQRQRRRRLAVTSQLQCAVSVFSRMRPSRKGCPAAR
jgi:hypothetical protein